MRPACSTTNSRFEPSPAWVRNTGLSKARLGKVCTTLIGPIGSIEIVVRVAGGGLLVGLPVGVKCRGVDVRVAVDSWVGVLVTVGCAGVALGTTGLGESVVAGVVGCG